MSKRVNPESLLIGAHTSAAGGAFNALLEGKEIGATTVQLFTANQKQWKGKPLSDEGVFLFKKALEETGLKKIMSHSSYLINLGSPDPESLQKSREGFTQELERCLKLGVTYLNFHPGAALKGSREECLDRIVDSLLLYEEMLRDGETALVLETTAGQGSSVGWKFEEIGYIVERVKKRVPIGVCIDTCHIFAAGYDIRTEEGWEKTLQEFDEIIGLKYLLAFHLNDSKKDFASRADRHEQLGDGKIGLESFRFLMNSKLTREIPKYLETPGGCPFWKKEITLLREFAKSDLCV
jgi:deoxyribonuclease IV